MIIFELILCAFCIFGGYQYGYEQAKEDMRVDIIELRVEELEEANAKDS